KVDRRGDRDAARMNAEDRLTAALIGRTDCDAAIEAPRAEESRIENIDPVRRREHDDTFTAGESIHLREDLVERLLAFVEPAAATLDRRASRAADRIDLVDEHDRGGDLARFCEEITYSARTDTDHHLDELRSRRGEERHARLARSGARQQRLPGARHAFEEN